MGNFNLILGDCKEKLRDIADCSVDVVVTSPPYFGLRDYLVDGQIGLEEHPQIFVERLTSIFREVKRVLKDTGTLWVNIGDSYNTSSAGNKTPSGISQRKPMNNDIQETIKLGRKLIKGFRNKDLFGVPWRLAFSLQDDGWILRQDIIWSKPNPMPESAVDRCTKSHEYIFLLSKKDKYYFDIESLRAPSVGYGTRNPRSVWDVPLKPFVGAHFATYPVELITPCILAGCPPDGLVLDPFTGSGTTGVAALNLNRNFIGIELNPNYYELASQRLSCAQSDEIWKPRNAKVLEYDDLEV